MHRPVRMIPSPKRSANEPLASAGVVAEAGAADRSPSAGDRRRAVAGGDDHHRQRVTGAPDQSGHQCGRGPGGHAPDCRSAAAAADALCAAGVRRRPSALDRRRAVRRYFERRPALAQSRHHACAAVRTDEDRHADDAGLVLPAARGNVAPQRLRGRGRDPAPADGADRAPARPRYGGAGARRWRLRDLLCRPTLEDHRRSGGVGRGGGTAGLERHA